MLCCDVLCVCSSGHESSSQHEHELCSSDSPLSATRHTLLPAGQHVQPQQVNAHLCVCHPCVTHVSPVFHPCVTCVCFSEEPPGWEVDIQHDVIEECNKHGGVVHIYVDKNSAEVHIT